MLNLVIIYLTQLIKPAKKLLTKKVLNRLPISTAINISSAPEKIAGHAFALLPRRRDGKLEDALLLLALWKSLRTFKKNDLIEEFLSLFIIHFCPQKYCIFCLYITLFYHEYQIREKSDKFFFFQTT